MRFTISSFFTACLLLLYPVMTGAQIFRGYLSDGSGQIKSKDDKDRQTIRMYYASGALEVVVHYKDGELDGLVQEYYETGKLKAEIQYKNNNRHGWAKFYYENGMLMGKIEYLRGKETGEAKFYDENGILSTVTPRLKRRLRYSDNYEHSAELRSDTLQNK